MSALELVCRMFSSHTGRRGRRRGRAVRVVHPVTPPPVSDATAEFPALTRTHPYQEPTP